MKNYIRNILIFIVTFSLVFGISIIPSYASSIDSTSPQYDYVFPNWYITSQSGSYKNYTTLRFEADDVYLFYFGSYFVFVSENTTYQNVSFSPVYMVNTNQGQPSSVPQSGTAFIGDDKTNLLYYVQTSAGTPVLNKQFPVFSDLNEGLAYVRDYIDNNSGETSSSYTNSYSLLNGYAITFDLGNTNQPYDIFVTQVQEHSSTGQFNNVKQTWGWSDTVPDTSTTFPRSSDTIIPYYKTGSDNIWGASNNGFSNKSTMVANGFWNETTNSRYLTIYNPYAIPIEQSLRNGAGLQFYYPEPINITITGAISYKLISLRSGMTNTGVQGGYTSDETDTTSQDIDGDGALTPEIDGKEPEKGGQNKNPDDINPIQSITGYLQNIQQTLSDFANSFISLLQAPISHVRQLIAAGSEYFGVIRGLYGWLPDEVQGTINSAMIVSISVGVIALLL